MRSDYTQALRDIADLCEACDFRGSKISLSERGDTKILHLGFTASTSENFTGRTFAECVEKMSAHYGHAIQVKTVRRRKSGVRV